MTLFFVPILVSCPLQFTSDDFLGKRIINYPSWIREESFDRTRDIDKIILGYSPWMEWQTEGKELQRFVKKVGTLDSEKFTGKFRLMLVCQTLYICFNDKDATRARFFCYIGDFKAYTVDDYWKEKLIEIPAIDTKLFEYDCYLREYNDSDFTDRVSGTNKAHVKFEKLEDENIYKYVLNVADREVINTKIFSMRLEPSKARLSKPISWMPYKFKEINPAFRNLNDYYGKGRIEFFADKKDPLMIGIGFYYGIMFSFEGITLRSIDESRRAISFYLEDRKEGDFADYFEIVIGDEEPYKFNSSQGKGRHSNGTLTFYKEKKGEPDVIVRRYGRHQTEFVFYEIQPYIKGSCE